MFVGADDPVRLIHLSLWERWPSAARAERVNDDHSISLFEKGCEALSVTCGDSSPKGRAKGVHPPGYLLRGAHWAASQRVAGVPRLRARGCGLPRQCEHWLAMTPLCGVRADRVVRPYCIKEYTVSFGGAQPDFLVAFSPGIGYNRRCKPEVAEKTGEKSAAQLQDDRHPAAFRYTKTQKEQGGTLWHLVNSCRRCAGRPD